MATYSRQYRHVLVKADALTDGDDLTDTEAFSSVARLTLTLRRSHPSQDSRWQ